MDDHQLDDLKQFIAAAVSQTETHLGDRIGKLEVGLEALRKEMLDGFAGVGEAIEEINKQVDERLTKLEQQAA